MEKLVIGDEEICEQCGHVQYYHRGRGNNRVYCFSAGSDGANCGCKRFLPPGERG